jgi:hypothetical protein
VMIWGTENPHEFFEHERDEYAHHSDWARRATRSSAGTWLPVWRVSCYEWSTCWTFVMCLKKMDEFCFPWILILFTCAVKGKVVPVLN